MSKKTKHKQVLALARVRKARKIAKEAQGGDKARIRDSRKEAAILASEAPPAERAGQGLGLFEDDKPATIRQDANLMRKAGVEDWKPPAINVEMAHACHEALLRKQKGLGEDASQEVVEALTDGLKTLASVAWDQLKAERPAAVPVQVTNVLPGSVVNTGDITVELTVEQEDAISALRRTALGVENRHLLPAGTGPLGAGGREARQADPGGHQ